jgi:hypothetical protein
MAARRIGGFLVGLGCLFAVTAWAQSPVRPTPAGAPPVVRPKQVPIFLLATTKDRTGIMLASALKEQLRTSVGMPLEEDPKKAPLKLRIVTVETDDSQNTAAVSVVVSATQGDALLGHSVFVVARDKVSSIAAEIIATLDQTIDEAYQAANRRAATGN